MNVLFCWCVLILDGSEVTNTNILTSSLSLGVSVNTGRSQHTHTNAPLFRLVFLTCLHECLPCCISCWVCLSALRGDTATLSFSVTHPSSPCRRHHDRKSLAYKTASLSNFFHVILQVVTSISVGFDFTHFVGHTHIKEALLCWD